MRSIPGFSLRPHFVTRSTEMKMIILVIQRQVLRPLTTWMLAMAPGCMDTLSLSSLTFNPGACPGSYNKPDSTPREKRSPVHSHDKRVQFSHEITFWFPASDQTALSEASKYLAKQGIGLQGGSCRPLAPSLKRTSTFTSAASFPDKVDRVPDIHLLEGPPCNVPHRAACTSGPKGFQGGSCRTLTPFSHPQAFQFCAAPPFERVEHSGHDAVDAGDGNSLSLSGTHTARQVGFCLPSLLNCSSGGLMPEDPAFLCEQACITPHGPPVLDFARKKPQAKSAAVKLGAAPYQPPQLQHPGLHRPLSQAGHFRVEEPCSASPQASFPNPFTSFDAVNGPRILAGEPEWLPDRYIIFALDTARLPGNPLPRFLQFELIDHPGPQVVITLDHGAGSFRAVVFDFRPLQGDIEVIDVPPTTTFLEQIHASRSLPNIDQAIDIVTGHACTTLLNGIIVAPSSHIPFDADLVLFKLWQDGNPVQTWRPFQFGDPRPPVPPIPEDAQAARTVPEPRRCAAASSSQAAALPRYVPVTAFAPEPRYSYLGVLEGVQNRPKPHPASDHACVQDVLTFLPRRGGPLDARVIPKPLPGLYTPQVLISRTLIQSGWHTIGVDLRPLNLGIKVANVRFGSSVRQLFAFDSPLQSELLDLGRGHLSLSFLLNLVPCVIDTAFHVGVDTLSVYPQQVSQGPTHALSQAAPASWNRRLLPVHPDRVWDLEQERTALFTVFDTVHHQRTFRRDELAEIDTLIAMAISVTPEIHDAEGFLILHGIPELPSPQIVLKSRETVACVVPLLFKLHPATVCTVEAPARASSFDVSYLAARACAALKGAHHQIARRTATIVGHHGSVDPFRAGAVHTHEALVLRGFSLSNSRRPRASHDLQFAHSDWVEARQWDPNEDLNANDLSRIVVHVARGHSGSVHVVPTASLRQIRDYISIYSPIASLAALQWPLICPAVPGAAPVALYLSQEAVQEAAHWAIVDLRRVGHPPLSPFIVLPLPPLIDITILLDHIRSELPSLRPIGGAFLNEYAVTNVIQATSPAMTVTLMRSVPRGTSIDSLPVPALDLNIDLLERRTALRATFNRHDGTNRAHNLQAGMGGSSSSSSVTEDATDASASFHSGSIHEHLDDDIDEVIPVTAAVTSTTTLVAIGMSDITTTSTSTTCAATSNTASRNTARSSSPMPRACNLVSTAGQVSTATIRIFAACGEHRPLHIALSPAIPPTSIGDILAQLTIRFDDLRILPNAAKWLVSSRALWTHEGDIGVFLLTGWGTLEPISVTVWIEPGHRWSTPYVISIPHFANRRQILSRVPLPGIDLLAITIDGILWDGLGRFFHNGQIIQFRSTWHRMGSLPLHALEDRLSGLNCLLIDCHGPTCLRQCLPQSQRDEQVRRHFQMQFRHWLGSLAPSERFNNIYLVIQSGPTLYLTLNTPLPPALAVVQEFFDSYCACHFGPRQLEDARFVWDDACVFVARTAGHDTQIWLLLGGPRLDVIQLHDDQNLSQIPAPAGRIWYPGEVQGNIGLAFLQRIEEATVCPAPARLANLQTCAPATQPNPASPSQPSSPSHSVHSIFGTSSSGNFTAVEDVEEAIAALLAVQDVLVEEGPSSQNALGEASEAASSTAGGPPGVTRATSSSSSSTSSSSPTEGTALLQFTASKRSTVKLLPTPCREGRSASTPDAHVKESARAAPVNDVSDHDFSLNRVICIELWTDLGFFAIPCPKDATPHVVSDTCSAHTGSHIASELLVPLFPQPDKTSSFVYLLRHTNSCFTTVLVQPPHGRMPLLCHLSGRVAAADICTRVGCTAGPVLCNGARWRGDIDGLFQGMHLCILPSDAPLHDGPCIPISVCSLIDPARAHGVEKAMALRLHMHRVMTMEWSLTADVETVACFIETSIASFSTLCNPTGVQHGLLTTHIYTDGSAIAAGAQFRLGSAFCVWHGRETHEYLQGCFATSLGCIQDHGKDGAFIAECHALCLALLWALSCPVSKPVILHYDSMRAGKAASGDWHISGASQSAHATCRRLRALSLLVSQRHDITFKHVKAHSGCVPNVIVDAFAKAAAYGRCHMPVPPSAAKFLGDPHLEWAWLGIKHSPALPPLDDVLSSIVNAPRPSTQIEMESGVANVGAPQHAPTIIEALSCRFVSFNVQSALDGKTRGKADRYAGGARLQLMFEVFDKKGWDFIGLQETRLKGDTVRATSRFLCFQSSSLQGQLGVAIWIAKSWKGTGGQPLRLQHFTVLHSDPRLLLIRCCSPHLKMDFCVAHAPQKGQGEAACITWWSDTRQRLAALARDSHPLILLIDANAHTGATSCHCIGDHGAEPDDFCTTQFEQLLIARQLWLPATFSGCHEGATHTFVSRPDSRPHRLDYVAVPLCWPSPCIRASFVDYDVELAHKADDHFPAVVDVSIQMQGSKRSRCPSLAWEFGDAEKLRSLGATAQVPEWDVSVDEHAHHLTKQMLFMQQKVFPRLQQAPKKPFICDTSWQLIRPRNKCRRLLKQLDSAERDAYLRQAFCCWRISSSGGAPGASCDFVPALARVRLRKAKQIRHYTLLCGNLRSAIANDKVVHLERIAKRCVQAFEEHDLKRAYRSLQFFRRNSKNVKSQTFALPKLELADGSLAQTTQERADRWLHHFSEVESAEPIPRELITILAGETQKPQQGQLIDSTGGCIPSMLDWERALRSGKSGKHPGPDGVRQELCKLHVPTIAQSTFPRFLKVALTGHEPLRFKGGLLTALYKGKGLHTQCSNSRSILLSNTLGKKWHSCLRTSALPFVERQMQAEQAGAVPHKTLDAAAMAIRAPAAWAQAQKKAAAILFLDVRSAFYTVFRPLLLGSFDDEEMFMYALRALKIPPIYAEWVRDVAEEGCIADRAGMPVFLREQILQTLHHSWFATDGSTELGYSMAGTRPGDPLGDLLFVLLCADVLRQLHEVMKAEGLTTPGLAEHLDPCLTTPAWMDDVALFQWADDSEQLMERIRVLCRLARDSFGKRGLILNTERGKSSCLPMLRGHRAKDIRCFQEQHWEKGVAYVSMAGQQSMPLTKSYKHLGGIIDFTMSLLPEVKTRASALRSELAALRKPIFANKLVPLSVRTTLLRTLVLSKATQLVGTWRELGVIESKAWRDGILQAYQGLHQDRKSLEESGRSLHSICGKFGLPHPDSLLTMARIRLYVQLAECTDVRTRHVLEQDGSPNSWQQAFLRDVAWVHKQKPLPSHLSLLLLKFQWLAGASGLLSCAQKAVSAHVTAMQQRALEESAVPSPPLPSCTPHLPISQSFACPLCHSHFATRRRLATHASKVHQVYSRARFYIGPSNTCWACHMCFHTRKRAVYHIAQCSEDCFTFLMKHFLPLDLETVSYLDSLTRKGGSLAGTVRSEKARMLVAPAPADLAPELRLRSVESDVSIPVLCSEDLPGPRSTEAGTKALRLERPA